MKVIIEIYQSKFNDEWDCNIRTQDSDYNETKYWSTDNFCDLLKLLSDVFPKSRCIGADKNETKT